MREDNMDSRQVADHFVKFATKFFFMAKSQYQQQNQIRANTLAFHALITLKELEERQELTMSQLAQELAITKQQLTKLVNDLEKKGLVERIHDQENRRQVYIRITPLGCSMMDELRENMLSSTFQALKAYTPEELVLMDQCLQDLTKLMKKFSCV